MQLYVSRHVLNADEIYKWFHLQGVNDLESPQDLHITQVYSKTDVNPDNFVFDKDNIILTMENSKRDIEFFGEDKNILVMTCSNQMMTDRFKYFENLGCSFDYDNYTPHITLSHNESNKNLMIYPESIILGPEIWEPLEV